MKYKKDKKIAILQGIEEKNKNDMWVTTWIPLPGAENIQAYYRHASGNEFFAAAKVNKKVEIIFEINWRGDIDERMKILYKGKEYEISQIDDFEGRKTDLKISAHAVNI